MTKPLKANDNAVANPGELTTEELIQRYAVAYTYLKQAQTNVAILKSELISRHDSQIMTALHAKDDPFGSVKIGDLDFNTPKKVDWDQDGLAALYKEIGDDAPEYIECKFGVKENAYKHWPSHIRDQFTPFRTVTPGATTVKIVGGE